MMASYEVFCYGELGVDNIVRVSHLPTPELAAFPSADNYHIGGAAANTAVWLAAWGVRVALAGNHIGRDEQGRQLLDWLRAYPALDLRYVERRDDVVTPFCRILVTPDAERTILVYWYPRTPRTALTPEMLNGARYLALDLYGHEERLAAARTARQVGVETVVGDVVSPDNPVLPITSLATISATYLRERFPGMDPLLRAQELQAISRGIVILTDGPRPISVLDREGQLSRLRPPAVEAVDSTGAGDAFRAGLLYGLLNEMLLPQAVCWGAAAGALKVTRVGGASEVPPLEEVASLAASLQVVKE